MSGGNLERDVADQLLEVIVRDRGLFARATSTSTPTFGAGVNISGDHPVARDFHAMESGNANVFTNFRDLRDRSAPGLLWDWQLVFWPHLRKRPEILVASDEVGLAIDLDQDADARSRLDVLDDDAFVASRPAFLQRKRRRACGGGLPRYRNSIGLSQGLFAFHQPALVISRSLPTFAADISAIIQILTRFHKG